MKSTFLRPATLLLSAFAWIITACNSPEKKMENAQENVNEAKSDLKEAQNEYNREWQKFHDDANLRIRENNDRIAGYRVELKNKSASERDRYEKRIAELETRNHTLEVRLNEYKDEGDSKWDSFKREFNHDMDELGNAIKDVFKNNEK